VDVDADDASLSNDGAINGALDTHGYNINGISIGYASDGLTVYANNFDNTNIGNHAYPNGSSSTGISGVYRVYQSQIHRIDLNNASAATKIEVANYGACLSCHSVQLFHAAPRPGIDYTGASSDPKSLPYDTLRYAPGRSVFNLLRGVKDAKGSTSTEDWNQHRQPSEYNGKIWDGKRGKSLMKGNFSKDPSGTVTAGQCDAYCGEYTTNVSRFTPPEIASVNNFEALPSISATGGSVVFTDTPTVPTIDGIHITKATYTSANATASFAGYLHVELFSDNNATTASSISLMVFTYDKTVPPNMVPLGTCGNDPTAWTMTTLGKKIIGDCLTDVEPPPTGSTSTAISTAFIEAKVNGQPLSRRERSVLKFP